MELCRHRLIEQDAEGGYPDVERVIPKNHHMFNGARFAVSSTYLAYLEKAFGKQCGMRFYARDAGDPIVVEPCLPGEHPLADARVIIMPVRW